ncbi:MAG: hypothetical protein ACOY0T_37775 [Myxococcota bacterium]
MAATKRRRLAHAGDPCNHAHAETIATLPKRRIRWCHVCGAIDDGKNGWRHCRRAWNARWGHLLNGLPKRKAGR